MLGTPHRLFYVPSAAFRPHPWHGLRTENLHGAKETPTAKKGRETPVRGGKHGQLRKRRSGEEKTVRGGIKPGRKQRQRSCPLMQQTPALHCGRCPCLWNDAHVLVMLAVDCIGLLFCVSKRRNVTDPRDRWGLWSLAGKGSVCPIPCHLTPWPGHRTTTRFKRQPAAPIHAHHSIAKDSDHNAGNGETETAMQMPNLTSRSRLGRTQRSR